MTCQDRLAGLQWMISAGFSSVFLGHQVRPVWGPCPTLARRPGREDAGIIVFWAAVRPQESRDNKRHIPPSSSLQDALPSPKPRKSPPRLRKEARSLSLPPLFPEKKTCFSAPNTTGDGILTLQSSFDRSTPLLKPLEGFR